MRIALGIEYDGHEFYGWQFQDGLVTIQDSLEKALSKICAEKISIICAGRTDAGVHATGQVVHFQTNAIREGRAWTFGTNTHLPPAISVRWEQTVDDSFHARFSATARSYRYIIYNHPIRTAILASRVTWFHYPLDATLMHEAAASLLGKHDFTTFRSSQCQSKTPIRDIHAISVTRQGEFVVMDIKANAFLHHMVRNIAGVLMRIGSGQIQPSVVAEILAGRDRRLAYETAAPTGLYLSRVYYPEQYAFPVPADSLLYF
jgi:tRNA pseudouridine38-40 synthase